MRGSKKRREGGTKEVRARDSGGMVDVRKS